jgi:hypothetical protein
MSFAGTPAPTTPHGQTAPVWRKPLVWPMSQRTASAILRDDLPVRFDRRNPRFLCPHPDKRTVKDGYDAGRKVDLWSCNLPGCVQCDARKRVRKVMQRAEQITREVRNSRRTWMDTFTVQFQNMRVYLADRGDTVTLARGDDAIAKLACSNQAKRLRKQRAPKHTKAVAWERHEGEHAAEGGDGTNIGKLHAHRFIHEKDEQISKARLAVSSYSQPRGFRPPRRRPGTKPGQQWGESPSAYYWRMIYGTMVPRAGTPWPKSPRGRELREQSWQPVIDGTRPWRTTDGLACGYRRWLAIRDDPSPEAQIERLRLPFQAGNVNCEIVDEPRGKRVASYAVKAARYTAKGGGQFTKSPRYGRDPTDAEGPANSSADEKGAPGPGSTGATTCLAGPQSGVAVPNCFQEWPPSGSSAPFNPQPRAPPSSSGDPQAPPGTPEGITDAPQRQETEGRLAPGPRPAFVILKSWNRRNGYQPRTGPDPFVDRPRPPRHPKGTP